MRDGKLRKIRKGGQRQEHQPDEKERGEAHDAVNHLPLRNEVHEIASDEGSFADGNEQRDGNVNLAVTPGNVRRQDRYNGSKEQRVEHIEIAPHMLAEMLGRVGIHNSFERMWFLEQI